MEAGACPTSNGQSTAGHSSEHRRASTGTDPGSMSRLRGRLRRGSRQHQALRSTHLRVSHTISVDHRDAWARPHWQGLEDERPGSTHQQVSSYWSP
eukprot:4448473-Prymnesium_polylepis.1